MENSIEFFLNTHLEWSISHQDFVITVLRVCAIPNKCFPVFSAEVSEGNSDGEVGKS